jgi:hypothetical protein
MSHHEAKELAQRLLHAAAAAERWQRRGPADDQVDAEPRDEHKPRRRPWSPTDPGDGE